jgi:hypothetical protein
MEGGREGEREWGWVGGGKERALPQSGHQDLGRCLPFPLFLSPFLPPFLSPSLQGIVATQEAEKNGAHSPH